MRRRNVRVCGHLTWLSGSAVIEHILNLQRVKGMDNEGYNETRTASQVVDAKGWRVGCCSPHGGGPRVSTRGCGGSSRAAASSCPTSGTGATRRRGTCSPAVRCSHLLECALFWGGFWQDGGCCRTGMSACTSSRKHAWAVCMSVEGEGQSWLRSWRSRRMQAVAGVAHAGRND